MNYSEYKKHLKDNERVESAKSVDHAYNAEIHENNIFKLKNMSEDERTIYLAYGVTVENAIAEFETEKELEYERAIKKSFPIEWIIGAFENEKEYNIYLVHLDEYRFNIRIQQLSTVAAVRLIDDDINDEFAIYGSEKNPVVEGAKTYKRTD